jgi:hypothetical protein
MRPGRTGTSHGGSRSSQMSAEQPEMSMSTLARLLALIPLSIDEKTQIQAYPGRPGDRLLPG